MSSPLESSKVIDHDALDPYVSAPDVKASGKNRNYRQFSRYCFKLPQLPLTALALLSIIRNASGAFYVDCAACHPVCASGMNITGFERSTNLAQGSFKLLKVTAGQTATIHFTVTNDYGGKYALNINSLGTAGINDTNHHLAFAPDPTWTNYFPGTLTNFFMAGPSAKVPAVWSFNLAVKTNTPPDLYLLKSQMAGYDSNHRKWSQQEEFCLQVIAP